MRGRASRGAGRARRWAALVALGAAIGCGAGAAQPVAGGGAAAKVEPVAPRIPEGFRLAKPEGHVAGVRCLAFSPDGRRLVSGSEDRTLLVWDVDSDRVVQRLEGHGGFVTACAFLPDGTIVSGAWGGEVRLWDSVTGREVSRLDGLSTADSVLGLSVRPDGGEVMVGTRHGHVRAWALPSGQVTFESDALADPSTSSRAWTVGYLDDGRRFGSSDAGRTVIWRDNTIGRRVDYDASSGLPLPGGRLLLGGLGELALLEPGGEPARFGREALSGWVYGLALSPRADLVLAADGDGAFAAWALADRSLQCKLPRSAGLRAAAFDPAGQHFALAGDDGTILVARAPDCKEGRIIEPVKRLAATRGRVASVAAGQQVLLGDSAGQVTTWSAEGWVLATSAQIHAGEVKALVPLPDGRFVSGGVDQKVALGDPATRRAPRTLGELRKPPWAIQLAPGGTSVLAADASGALTLLPLDGGEAREILREPRSLYALAGRPGKPEVVTGGAVSDLLHVRLPPAEAPARWPQAGPRDSVTALAYSPDGRWIAEGGTTGTVALRDADTGAVLERFAGLDDQVSGLALTADHLWAGGAGARLARWLLPGRPASPFEPIDEGAFIHVLARTPDDRFLIAGLGDGRAAVRALPSGALVAHLYPLRDGSWATVFADGTFKTSGSGAALDLRFEHPASRKVATLGGPLPLHLAPATTTRLADGSLALRGAVLSPSGPPSVVLDGRWPVRALVPSPTVLAAYELEIFLDDPTDAPHRLDVTAPDGSTASTTFRPAPDLQRREPRRRAPVIGNGAYPREIAPPRPGGLLREVTGTVFAARQVSATQGAPATADWVRVHVVFGHDTDSLSVEFHSSSRKPPYARPQKIVKGPWKRGEEIDVELDVSQLPERTGEVLVRPCAAGGAACHEDPSRFSITLPRK